MTPFLAAWLFSLIYGLNAYEDRQQSLEFAVAASAFKHTITGDLSRVTVSEVEKLMSADGSGRVQRQTQFRPE